MLRQFIAEHLDSFNANCISHGQTTAEALYPTPSIWGLTMNALPDLVSVTPQPRLETWDKFTRNC